MSHNTAILDEPECATQLWPLSVEAYHALGESGLIPKNTELLHGFVFNKMSKSPLHTILASRLAQFITQELAGRNWWVRTEQPLTLADSEPEPDVSVVTGVPEDYWEGHPATAELVVEVAVTSAQYDRSKAKAYAAAGVKEFWIVLGSEGAVEVLRQPAAGGYLEKRRVSRPDTLVCACLPGLRVDLENLFSR